MSCPRAETRTERICCDKWNKTLSSRQGGWGYPERKPWDDFDNMVEFSFRVLGLRWIATYARFCPYCGSEIKTVEKEVYPCDTGCFDDYDGDESPNVHNDSWGSQGPDCITMPREAAKERGVL